ncbi:hypothetical protein EFA69_03690 [Rufibacter immobilis]|uniref:Uncharacterized protein n=1 Tax=Rufibacter immobilis TaxID=1348778 RepID=A0A3M9N3X0_9BACT|nr:hypothetical protein [Rufibacter immobilis]RNI32436.1 hypothetical protein EFA69_03690 [Rufibacter immobilis]
MRNSALENAPVPEITHFTRGTQANPAIPAQATAAFAPILPYSPDQLEPLLLLKLRHLKQKPFRDSFPEKSP